MTENAYIRSIAFFTLLMAVIVAGGSWISYSWTMNWTLLITTFIASIAFIVLFNVSDNPFLSFIGVGGMSTALGLMIGPALHHYKQPVVMQAVMITAIIMIIMSIAGIMFPRVFRGWGPYLLGALIMFIIVQIAQSIFVAIGFKEAAHMPIMSWIGIAIFVGFVAYDWARALDQEHTLDNAIDASGGLILDAVNLLLQILAAKDD